jgi:hypothetical protein
LTHAGLKERGGTGKTAAMVDPCRRTEREKEREAMVGPCRPVRVRELQWSEREREREKEKEEESLYLKEKI